jgi:hypothetical protein
MFFTNEDRNFMKSLYMLKCYNAARLLAEFSEKNLKE